MALPASALSFLDNRLKVECSNVVKQKELGRGSFGAVYLAEVNGLPSCVKELHALVDPELYGIGVDTSGSGIVRELSKEIEALASLHCDRIVSFRGVVVSGDDMVTGIVMEAAECNLRDYFKSLRRHKVLPELRRLSGHVFEGLACMHSLGYIHRDVKPANVLVFVKDGTRVAKLGDVGLSRSMDAESARSSLRANAGTPYYTAPDIPMGLSASDKLDIFSVGIMMSEILATYAMSPSWTDLSIQRRFELVDHVVAWLHPICPEFSNLIRECCDKDPAKRPTAHAAHTVLNNLACKASRIALKAIRRACGRVGLGDHDIVDDLQEMARLDPLLSPVGVSEYMLSQGMDEAIVRSVRQELEGSLCLGESLEPVVCGSDASASSPVASTASTSISAGSSVQDTLSSQRETNVSSASSKVTPSPGTDGRDSRFHESEGPTQRELVVASAHDVPDPISEHAVDPTPEAEAEAEGDIMEALRRRWQAEEEDKEREAAAIAARSKQREVSAAVIAEEEMQRREAILRSQREAAALKQLKRQQAQVDDPVSAVPPAAPSRALRRTQTIRTSFELGNYGIALHPDCKTLVVSTVSASTATLCLAGDVVSVYTLPGGRRARVFGGRGARLCEFNKPSGLCFTPRGTIMVADAGNLRVQELSLSGDCERVYPNLERLMFPVIGVSCSRDFVAVCLDTRSRTSREDCVIIYDRVSGRQMFRYGARRHNGYVLDSCVSIRFSPAGTSVLLVDAIGRRVLTADALGNVKSSFDVISREDPRDAFLCPDGTVLVLTATTLACYSSAGDFLYWVIPAGSQRDRAFTSLCVSSTGTCYVVDSCSPDVLVFQ